MACNVQLVGRTRLVIIYNWKLLLLPFGDAVVPHQSLGSFNNLINNNSALYCAAKYALVLLTSRVARVPAVGCCP